MYFSFPSYLSSKILKDDYRIFLVDSRSNHRGWLEGVALEDASMQR